MKRPPWLTKEVIGWSLFDFANQAFTMVMITVMFQVYFINHVVPKSGDDNAPGKRLWELSNISAELVIIALSPLAGALADFSGSKKKFLFITYIGCVAFNIALGVVGPGDIAWAMSLFILAYVFFGIGENFLNAFLPEIADHRDMGKVSAFSWTIAYVGALVSMGVAVLILQLVGEPLGYCWISVWCGLYFLIGGAPTFFLLRERKLAENLPPGQTIFTVGFHRLRSTFRQLRQYKQLFRFFLIVMIYLAGMQVVIFYAGSITHDMFHFEAGKQGLFMLQIIVSGIVGTAITGRYQDRIGTRTTIMICLAIWAVTLIVGGIATREWQFWVTGNLVGFSMGALGTASRVMAGLFSPQHKAGEFFGFYGMAQKLAVIIGLGTQFILGTIGLEFNVAIGASAVFFIIGFFLMFTINEKEGRITALRAAREHIRKHHDYAGEISDAI